MVKLTVSVYRSMDFQFHHPKTSLVLSPSSHNLPVKSLAAADPNPITTVVSFEEFRRNGTIQYVAPRDWLFLLCVISWRFQAGGVRQYLDAFCCWGTFHCVIVAQCTRSPAERHCGCSQVWVVIDRPAINILVQFLCEHQF